ncbi:tubulin gamma complex associated family protein [Aspergillus tanneri]|uniref:Spindle pole body component n=1 Tax=Aspergillus tanneri TaxID=1220188 RepID=A0A5M9MXK2_9EURO|nr:uncharacterized protein ATNIH1004_000729 [Aspergillus tanneri]KAA8651831.1 hypothetical protein ATNIH1004_000729 [Aspergillus tanneri]
MCHAPIIMDREDYDVNPFSGDSLWRISEFTLQSLQPLEPLSWNGDLPDLSGDFFQTPLHLFDETWPKLPESTASVTALFDFSQQPESTTGPSSDSQSDINIDQQDNEGESSDIWALDNLNSKIDDRKTLRSWENYKDRSYCEPVSAYFSESGTKGFDGALTHQFSQKGIGTSQCIARNDVFFQALFRLGLGWGSTFFRYNQAERKFEPIFNNIRISGVSVPVVSSIMDELLRCGSDMQRVRIFLNKVPSRFADLSALSTLSSVVAIMIYTLEQQLLKYSKNFVSLIQIKSLFHRSGELLAALADLVEAAEGAVSDAQVISTIIERAAHYSQTFGQLEDLFREVVIRIVEPFLLHVESWIGFRQESLSLELASKGKSFVALDFHEESAKSISKAKASRVDFKYQPDQIPSFLPRDQAQLIFESGRSLRLLKRFHPQHPIANDLILNTYSPKLECAGSWNDIERIQKRAYEYEKKLRSEILRYNCRGDFRNPNTQNISQNTNYDDEKLLEETFDIFDIDDKQNLTGLLSCPASMEKDKLGGLLNEANTSGSKLSKDHTNYFGPELTSSLYLSLAPFLSSQAQLIDFSCLHLLFKEHKVRYHLTLQWRFQLLGDGFFTSRLSHSLFDPEMESGERKAGVMRSGVHTGLRLGSRDTWPPASSELRLVLIGLLNECRNADDHSDTASAAEFRKDTELPGGLSFSIRELSTEEIIKCKDPNAIEALDFLRLQYKPSDVLKAIITQQSLNKYDRLFKHLLRLLRMVSVVKGLIRDTTARGSLSRDTRNEFQKFRVDSQHFVLALSDYCFHIGVGATWQRFQETLSKIESCLERDDVDGTIEVAHSLPRLRDYHEDVLDQMLFALFLSKSHTDAARLLENIFTTILNFAPLSKLDGMRGVRRESEITVRRLYAVFRKQTSAFVGYLRKLDGVKASSKSFGRFGTTFSSREPTSVFNHLLSRLDIKTYY